MSRTRARWSYALARRTPRALGALLGALALLATIPAAGADATIRRFALVAGVNHGGEGRLDLRFATSDARAFARVLEDLGGVAPGDRLLLLDVDAEAFAKALQDLRVMVSAARAPDRRLEVVLYYSGHSDEDGLLFGERHYTYTDLRRYLEALPADVRVAILDSCASGAMTRHKGGRHLAPFLVDVSADVRGHAFLTSSSENEAAQESDRVGGSFFTHYLVSGLRGAADASGDGRVTLTEAYQFAFNETLARTESTQSGPQHAAYDIELAGSGDLVLTDLRGTTAGLTLDPSLEGRLFVRDSGGRLVAELQKNAGRTVELGLEPGAYDVTVARAGRFFRAALNVRTGEPATLSDVELVAEPLDVTAARGSSTVAFEVPSQRAGGAGDDPRYLEMPFAWTVVPGLDNTPRGVKTSKRLSLNVFVGDADRVHGLELGMLLNVVREDLDGVQIGLLGNVDLGPVNGVQIGYVFNYARADLKGVSLASGFSLVGGNLRGVQVAGGMALIGGDATRAFQSAGGASLVLGTLDGVQLSGGVNYLGGGTSNGTQLAGGANVSMGAVRGFQGAGGVNYARGIYGVQLATINVSGDVYGAQVGVINIASGIVQGTQVGIINIGGEYESGTPIGLFNFPQNGEYALDLWGSDLSAANLSFKFGGRYFYSLLTLGGNPTSDPRVGRALAMFGLGASVPLGEHVFAATDVSGGALEEVRNTTDGTLRLEHGFTESSIATWRLLVGGRLFAHLSLFGGVAMHSAYSSDLAMQQIFVGRPGEMVVRQNGQVWRVFPGLFAGLRI